MFPWPAKRTRALAHYRIDDTDRPFALNQKSDPGAAACAHLPAGIASLRRLRVDGLSTKEIPSALALWVEESLPEPIDAYVWDSWKIDAGTRGLVALPRARLDKIRQQLAATGVPLRALRVPELMPPTQTGKVLVLWDTPDNLLACFWSNQILHEWQSFPLGVPTRAVLEQANTLAGAAPQRILLISPDHGTGRDWDQLASFWPEADLTTVDPIASSGDAHLRNDGPAFLDYLYESQRQPAASGDRLRLGLAIGAACLSALFLFNADVVHRERQVEQLRHEVSLLKVRANRSKQLATRSGETLRKVRALRTMTIERNGVNRLLQVLTDALPPRVKIKTVSVERSGAAALDGVAETEVDVSSFLERLRRSPLLGGVVLSFSEKDTDENSDAALIRFRLQVRWSKPLLTLPNTEPATPTAPAGATPREQA